MTIFICVTNESRSHLSHQTTKTKNKQQINSNKFNSLKHCCVHMISFRYSNYDWIGYSLGSLKPSNGTWVNIWFVNWQGLLDSFFFSFRLYRCVVCLQFIFTVKKCRNWIPNRIHLGWMNQWRRTKKTKKYIRFSYSASGSNAMRLDILNFDVDVTYIGYLLIVKTRNKHKS